MKIETYIKINLKLQNNEFNILDDLPDDLKKRISRSIIYLEESDLVLKRRNIKKIVNKYFFQHLYDEKGEEGILHVFKVLEDSNLIDIVRFTDAADIFRKFSLQTRWELIYRRYRGKENWQVLFIETPSIIFGKSTFFQNLTTPQMKYLLKSFNILFPNNEEKIFNQLNLSLHSPRKIIQVLPALFDDDWQKTQKFLQERKIHPIVYHAEASIRKVDVDINEFVYLLAKNLEEYRKYINQKYYLENFHYALQLWYWYNKPDNIIDDFWSSQELFSAIALMWYVPYAPFRQEVNTKLINYIIHDYVSEKKLVSHMGYAGLTREESKKLIGYLKPDNDYLNVEKIYNYIDEYYSPVKFELPSLPS